MQLSKKNGKDGYCRAELHGISGDFALLASIPFIIFVSYCAELVIPYQIHITLQIFTLKWFARNFLDVHSTFAKDRTEQQGIRVCTSGDTFIHPCANINFWGKPP